MYCVAVVTALPSYGTDQQADLSARKLNHLCVLQSHQELKVD